MYSCHTLAIVAKNAKKNQNHRSITINTSTMILYLYGRYGRYSNFAHFYIIKFNKVKKINGNRMLHFNFIYIIRYMKNRFVSFK